MRRTIALSLGAALLLAGNAPAAEQKPLTSQKEKASYGVGMNVGKRFRHEFIDLDIDAFARGFADALRDAAPAVNPAELDQAMTALRKEVEQKAADQGVKNKQVAEEFLAKNKSEKGVQTTKSGLQYIVLKEGSGPIPKSGETVKVHYKGTLLDGTEFDSSYKRNEPATFPVEGVIPGWVEALKMMKVGSKWKLFVPPALAYGEAGQPPIPPNSLLIFEVELLGIENSPKK